MKVRWTDGSVRLRITPSELEALRRGEAAAVGLALPGGEWRAEIRPGGTETGLTLEGGSLRLVLSDADRDRLAAPDAEGVYFRTGEGVRYFIEKDFPCVHPRPPETAETAGETFAPPPGFAERHRTVC